MTDFGKDLEAANERRRLESRMRLRQSKKLSVKRVPKISKKNPQPKISYRSSESCHKLSEFTEAGK